MTRLPPPAAHDSKAAWRAWARERRSLVPDGSAQIVGHLRSFLATLGARRVLAYHALPGEPDISALRDGFELFTTRARFKPQVRLTVHPYDTAREVSRFGVRQPPADAPQVPLESLDIVLLPGLAFDEGGVRLGYGSGFYDRLLPGFAGPTVGVVWDELLVPTLPSEAHDCRVGWLASPTGVRAARPPG